MTTYTHFITKHAKTLGSHRALFRSLRRQGVDSARQQRKRAKDARRP